MCKRILTSLLATIGYIVLLWGGLATGILVATRFEDMLGMTISKAKESYTILFVGVNIILCALLVLLIIVVLLKTPPYKINVLDQVTIVRLARNALIIGFVSALIYRGIFQIVSSTLFYLPK